MTEQSGHYTVLARRFRPQTFDEVVGQERIGQALRNAIASDRVAHAYLFTGARGVGKTSTARIFAKALNCPHVKDAVPCNECEVCRSIAAGSDVDVLEIDGASNRGIDDIRSLRANVNVKSMRSPYKVYIIDEVHMLTKEAFNALLKTLEEPPPRVKFIFCTTEPNKVPDTILSRCQRFDFGTIASDSIKGRLASIAAAEGVEVADEALDLIARRAAGSMRDSQSLFDQLLAFGGEQITATDVHQLLGTASDDRLVALIDAIIERRRDTALNLLDSSLREGVQISSFSDQVLHYLRDLLVVAVGAEGVTLQSVGESHRSRLQEQAQLWGLNTITAAMQILSETKSRMQRVNYDRALMELAVIRLSLLEDLDNIGVTIEMVRSGGGTTPQRIPAPTRVTQPSTISTPATPLAPADGSPKSLETPAQPESVIETHPVSPSPPKSTLSPQQSQVVDIQESPRPAELVDFAEASLKEFWSEVTSRTEDKLAGHLKTVSNLAISGPNDLVLSIPQSYFLSRQYCDRPESISQLESIAQEVCGRKIGVTFRVVENEAPESNRSSESTAPQKIRRRIPKVDKDAFVEQALSIFGATVVDVREIHEAANEE